MSQKVCRHPNCGEVESHFVHHLIDVVGHYQGHQFEPADDTGGERQEVMDMMQDERTNPREIWKHIGKDPAPSADQPEWIIAAAREIHTKRLTDTLAMAHVIQKHCGKPSADGRRDWVSVASGVKPDAEQIAEHRGWFQICNSGTGRQDVGKYLKGDFMGHALQFNEVTHWRELFPAPAPVSGEGREGPSPCQVMRTGRDLT